MGLCWQRRSSTTFFLSLFCFIAITSTAVLAQNEECELAQDQCASPRSGWFSRLNAERAPGSNGFTAVDLTWEPFNPPMPADYIIAYKALDTENGSYMFSMRIVDTESYRLEGLEHDTSYFIAVCRPLVNQSILSEREEPLLIRECGYCSTCRTTRTSDIEITLASHDIDLNGETETFECEAFGEPRPNPLIWTAVDPITNERVQLFDGDRGVNITHESLVGNGRLSFLTAPIEEDLLFDGEITCTASNGIVEDVADQRRFTAEDETPTQEATTTDPPDDTINPTVTLPTWAIAVIVVVIIAMVIGMSVLCPLVLIKHRLLRRMSTKDTDSSIELAHNRHKSNDYYHADYSSREANRTNDLEDSFSLAIAKDKIIPSSNIKISKVIGQGEFGVVYKGTLTNGSSCELVAVKTLKGIFATDADIKSASEEILKMQSFNHPNVMMLIGVCVSGEVGGSGGPSIVMPYMSKGSLLDYLRKEGSAIKPTSQNDVTQIGSVQKLLLQISLQVAKGMEYLAGLKFVHRDLAARNCMIGYNGNIKVADFGLAEDVYMRNYFRQNEGSSVKLPIKWMALESLKLGVFSEKSDVWSYGVTCWEVFSAGEIPYPGVHPREVIKLIEDEERMDKPKNAACSDDMYGLIASCWASEPDDRPVFSEIVSSLESKLLGLSDYLQLSISVKDQDGISDPTD